MATIRLHRGRLFIDYRDEGSRQRIYTKLQDTPPNRMQLERVAAQIDEALRNGKPVQQVVEQAGLASTPRAMPPRLAVPAPQLAAALEVATPGFLGFAEQWFNEFKVSWRKTYVVTVRGILDQHLLPRFGAHPIAGVSRALILDFRAHLATVKGRRPGSKLSPARINTIMLILRQILQEAADRYEFKMPMERLKPLKVPKSDVMPFSLDQTHLLINSIRKDYRNYLKVRFFTGMRTGEIHGLKWKYVDFEHNLILVREAFVAGEDEYTKNDSSQRDIPMNQVVRAAMLEQHKATGQMTYVFGNRAGEPVDTNNFTKRVWYPLLRHLKLDLRRPYQTRHTAATLWLAAGESPAWVATVLGHASQEMLWRRYARFLPNLTRQDGSAMDRLLNTVFKQEPANGPDAQGGSQPAQPPPTPPMALAA